MDANTSVRTSVNLYQNHKDFAWCLEYSMAVFIPAKKFIFKLILPTISN